MRTRLVGLLIAAIVAGGCSSGSDDAQPAICEETEGVVDVASLGARLRDPATAAQAAGEVLASWDRAAAVAPREIAAPVDRTRELMYLLNGPVARAEGDVEQAMSSVEQERYEALLSTSAQDSRAITDYLRRHCRDLDGTTVVDRGPAPIEVKSLAADAAPNLAIKQRLKAAGLCLDNPVNLGMVWASGAGGEITSLACGLGVSVTSFEDAADTRQVIAYRQSLCGFGAFDDLSFAVDGATLLEGKAAPLEAAAKALGWNSARYCP